MSVIEERKAIEALSASWRRLITGARRAITSPPPELPEGQPSEERPPPSPGERPGERGQG